MKISILSSFLSLILLFISSISGCNKAETSINNEFPLGYVEIESGDYEYHIPERYYSEGIKNIVKRARQIKEITWMPLNDLEGFNGDYIFNKGNEVEGIPYSQPVFNGEFLMYPLTLEKYLSESKNQNGVFYTEKGTYEEPSTYYGMDCSSFISYAWNQRNRLTAKIIADFGDCHGNAPNKVQVGDALIRLQTNRTHAVLVTGVKEDKNNNVIWIEITEQTPPVSKRTRYGDGELFSFDDFLSMYLDDGYQIYRYTSRRDIIPYTHSCASPVDDWCDNCYSLNERKSLKVIDDIDSNIIFEAEFGSLNEVKEIKFTYSISHIHLGIEKYVTDLDKKLTLYKEPNSKDSIITVPARSSITIFNKIYDDNGNLWGRTKYNSKTGWLNLTNSTYLGGEVTPGESITVSSESVCEIIHNKYTYSARCIFRVPKHELKDGTKLQVFAHDSNGNIYKVGEYINDVY